MPARAYLVSCQDPEGCHNLLSSVCVRGLSGHKVNERLEGHKSSTTGIHEYHYTGKLNLSLAKEDRIQAVFVQNMCGIQKTAPPPPSNTIPGHIP